MGLLDKQIYQQLPGIAVGIGAALVTQMLVMGVMALAKPLAKAAIRSGFIIRDVCSMAVSPKGQMTQVPEERPLRRLPRGKTDTPSLN